MVGHIFFLLQTYVQKHLGPAVWGRVFAEAGLPPRMYMPHANYPDEEVVALVQAMSRVTGRSVPDLLESFGEAMVPDLLSLFRTLLQPEWKTLDLLENVESVHKALWKRYPAAQPPAVQCLRFSETQMQIVYASHRRLCALARGIIKGVAAQYDETIDLIEHTCSLKGDPFCTFQVTLIRQAADGVVLGATHPMAPGTPPDAANPWKALSPLPHVEQARAGEQAGTPAQVTHYRILRQLGAGGMGIVYLAEDGLLGRRVALKLMQPAMAAFPDHRERFLREARAMAALSNDHIVTVYQVGFHGDQPFIAMQLLQGRTLEHRLQERGRLPGAEVVRIGLGIATGLAAAHESGLVHRDVKPDNIWLEEPGDRVKILDFGLVRAESGEGQATLAGGLLGTPLYMSPEQAAGERVDGRSDLFSLGVVLYRMCAGRTPFEGASAAAVLRSILVDPAPPLTEGPPELTDLIALLLAKDPSARPASARDLAKTLSALAPRVPA